MPLPISDEEKERVTDQVFSLFAVYGFQRISMDRVAEQVGLSKATLYKYFKSKEDIARGMVDRITYHLNDLPFTTSQGIKNVLTSLSSMYYEGVLIAAYFSTNFITDLRNKFPSYYDNLMTAIRSTEDRFVKFYSQAVRENYCRDISLTLACSQICRTLPTIIRPEYRAKYNFELTEMLENYYQLMICQMLNTPYLDYVDDKRTYSFIEDKLIHILREKFCVR